MSAHSHFTSEFVIGQWKDVLSSGEIIGFTPSGRTKPPYMKSAEFSPTETLTSQQLQHILTTEVKKQDIVGVKNQSDYDVQPE